ncbi:hypothetical protein SAMN05216282_101106 [Cryobacterium psychrotolerans]|uniref:Uncharacterized protein n=1 Tax=Cryobacterium psychrotolerans TaxID=386301 RepID=A0A1G8X8X7_9MICO|nr:hypothetical protein [Cryobacterium psychrotolerans]TFD83012.1 hypothetical protein E3T56_14875 [Cryobacterium psychrotolerans]SDJ86200.1 hypothetical protein SAMN05216282_101106 [Cryobacterium psychrotolerans]
MESPELLLAVAETIEILESIGYHRLAVPYSIGEVQFDYGIPLVAGEGSLDLVIIDQVGPAAVEEAFWNLQSIAQSLDVAGSFRTLTLIAIGPPIRHDVAFHRIQAFARVLLVDTTQTSLTVEEQIAPLIPFHIENTDAEALEDPLKPLQDFARSSSYASPLTEIVAQSELGILAVETRLLRWFEEPLQNEDLDATEVGQK